MNKNVKECLKLSLRMSDETIYLLENADSYESFLETQINKHIQTKYNGHKDSFISKIETKGAGYYFTNYSTIEGVSPTSLENWCWRILDC